MLHIFFSMLAFVYFTVDCDQVMLCRMVLALEDALCIVEKVLARQIL